MREKPNLPIKKDGRASVGMAFTVAWVGTVLVYIVCRFDTVTALDPNEFGDFLAGAFGPVALFWLVLGYFQQGDELQQNTDALKHQAAELQASVIEQRNLVELTRSQLEFEQRRYQDGLASARRAAQPILKVRMWVHDSPGRPKWRLRVQNEGPSCALLSVSLARMRRSDLVHARLTSIEPHEWTSIVDVDNDAPFNAVMVSYRDGRGEVDHQYFSVNALDAGGPIGVDPTSGGAYAKAIRWNEKNDPSRPASVI